MMKYIVRAEEEGRRLRDVLRRSMLLSYSALKRVKWNGEILLNGVPAHTDVRVHAGDLVQASWPEDEPAYPPRPCPMKLNIPWMDEDLIIVDKPAGIASQSSRNHPEDSLENGICAFLGCTDRFVYRPVNRLDKGTGGLMVIARNAHSQQLLQQQLHTPDFRRRYLALTDGIPSAEKGILDYPIAKAAEASVRRRVDPGGKPSVTRYRVLEERENGALVLLELETGRTHQIRVHLSHIGCPVHGDFLYGQEDPENFPGCFALHSAVLRLKHPVTGEALLLTSVPAWAGDTDPALLTGFVFSGHFD